MSSPVARIHTAANHLEAQPSGDSHVLPEEQVVVITGCTSGLGLHLCLEFMRLGFKVCGCGRREKKIRELNVAHQSKGHKFYTVDISNAKSVIAWSHEVLSDFGRVDTLIANAGKGGAGKLPWEIDVKQFSEVLDTNVKGVFLCCQNFIQPMLDDLTNNPQRMVVKRVINMSSGVGHSTSPVQADYSASKWGVEAFSKSTAQAFHVLRDTTDDQLLKRACDKILCVPLAPGVIQSEMNPTPGIPTPEEWCTHAAAFIMSISVEESGSSLTVPGFYSEEYMQSWVIPDGMPLPTHWMKDVQKMSPKTNPQK
jgi:NAD(P)-dependent dehydrogenase (short-subunit alcohol dehydrogenase family)